MTNPLPETGLLRLPQIIGRPATKRKPAIHPIIPVCRSTWYAGIRDGRFPEPVRLGPMAVAWRVEDIRALIEEGSAPVNGDQDAPDAEQFLRGRA